MGLTFYVAAVLVLGLNTLTLTEGQKFESSKQWWDLARSELAAALNVRDNWGTAKNVILFLGDGMGIAAQTAARIYKGQKKGMHGEEGYLEWERFPNSALIKTYNVDRQVPDSAATATAFLCGVKVNFETLGVDPRVMFGDCEGSKNPDNQLTSVLQWAQEAGKSTGIVTSTRVTHATPAATYAHAANRRWECNRKPGEEGHGCPDIAEQLVSHNPGKNIKVIMGGGRQTMGATLGIPDRFSCNRTDNRDLTREWLQSKKNAGQRAQYITSAQQLRSTNVKNLDYLMGLFADSNIPFAVDTAPGSSNTPSLAEMSQAAITLLSKDRNGYFLLVEGGRIDHAYHNNLPKKALEETLAFEEAVTAALKSVNLEETLVVVTADHSHVLTINGYPKRGNDILGFADVSEVDGLPYTTLMFTNGPGFNMTTDGVNVTRADPRLSPLISASVADENNFARCFTSSARMTENDMWEDEENQKESLIDKGFLQYLYDDKGAKYLDTVNSVACVGHGEPRVNTAAVEALKNLSPAVHYQINNVPVPSYEFKMRKTLSPHLDTFLFCDSGSEAVDLAVRLSRLWYAKNAGQVRFDPSVPCGFTSASSSHGFNYNQYGGEMGENYNRYSSTPRGDLAVVEGSFHGCLNSVRDFSSRIPEDRPEGRYNFYQDRRVHVAPLPDMYRITNSDKINGSESGIETAAVERYLTVTQQMMHSIKTERRELAAFMCEPLLTIQGGIHPPGMWLQGIYR